MMITHDDVKSKPIPSCPKCGKKNTVCCSVMHEDNSLTFEYYECMSCLYRWNPYDKVKVIFT